MSADWPFPEPKLPCYASVMGWKEKNRPLSSEEKAYLWRVNDAS